MIFAAEPFWYMITDRSGKCWDLENGNAAGGTAVQLYDCQGSGWANQGWTFVPISGMPQDQHGGYYTIRPYKSYNMCLNVYGGSTQDEARMIIWQCDQSRNEMFYVRYNN